MRSQRTYPAGPPALLRREKVRAGLDELCRSSNGMSASGGWFSSRAVAAKTGVCLTTVQDDLRVMSSGTSGVEHKKVRSTSVWRIKNRREA